MANRLSGLKYWMPLFWQISRFGVVGLSAALVHFSTVVALVHTGVCAPLIANLFGFFVAFQVSYMGHRFWTFGGSDVIHRTAVPKLIVVQSLNFVANETLFYIFLLFHFPYQVALLMTLTVLPAFTFIANKRWVFKAV